MHIALPLGTEGTILMATDAIAPMNEKLRAGTNYSICFNPDSKEDADKIFNGLAKSGAVEMPIGDTFWGAYWGCLTDKFGIQWMINYDTSRQAN